MELRGRIWKDEGPKIFIGYTKSVLLIIAGATSGRRAI
jgi:hypothetical protein